ncbi:MAG: RluA family pseudouridine synthase [Alicyclobacillaceae bacterium]|nr:RluA family pseudouridine synthase [Alicyclobacillaceae bacterium]
MTSIPLRAEVRAGMLPAYRLTIDERLHGRMVRSLLLSELKFSRRSLSRLARAGSVRRNGKAVYFSARVEAGDVITVTLPPESPSIPPEPMALDIRYEDAEVIVVNKPPGVLTHPSGCERRGTLLAGVQAYLGPDGGVPHCVHRLDRDTSGLVMFAKHAHIHHLYDMVLRAGGLHRTYCAIAHLPPPAHNEAATDGQMSEWCTIDLPIGQDPVHLSKRTIARESEGKRAVTHYRQVARCPRAVLLEVVLETGRTHQIRLHMAACQMPLYGDPHYRGMREAQGDSFVRQALHAHRLTWRHPVTGVVHQADAPPPADMVALWSSLGGDASAWSRLAPHRSDEEEGERWPTVLVPGFSRS